MQSNYRKNPLLIRLLFLLALMLPLAVTHAQTEITHVVQSGETLFRIALRYGLTTNELATANNINDPTRILAGQTLIIPGDDIEVIDIESEVVENPLIAATPLIHVVQRGETLGEIARVYDITIDQILEANNIPNINRINAGQELQIWTANSALLTEPEAAAVEAEPTPIPDIVHTVKPGEYLAEIAKNYGVSWELIAQANNITDPNRIEEGVELRIPSVTAAEAITDLGILEPPPRPDPGARIGVGRELVVVLSEQMAYAYEDGILQNSAVVSTGLPNTPTVQGDYEIWHKTPEQTMSGPGYYLPGVKWVMYFYQGYGFHGTYWHNNFGQPMSSGCVNMTDEDAKWFYDFAELGTPVHVRAS